MNFQRVEKFPKTSGLLRVVVRNKNYTDSLNVLFQDVDKEKEKVVYIPTGRNDHLKDLATHDLLTHDWTHAMDSPEKHFQKTLAEYHFSHALRMAPDWVIFESLYATVEDSLNLNDLILTTAETGHNAVVVIDAESTEEAFSMLEEAMFKCEQGKIRLPRVFKGIYMNTERYVAV